MADLELEREFAATSDPPGSAADLEKYLEAGLAGWRVIRLGPNEPGPKPQVAGDSQPEPLDGSAWEYTLLDNVVNKASHDALNEAGKEGWEVSAVLQGHLVKSSTLLLKRRKK